MNGFTQSGIDLRILVSNLDRSLPFYRDAIGLDLVESRTDPEGGRTATLTTGGSCVTLVEPGDPATPHATDYPATGVIGLQSWTVHVSDLDALLERCQAAGHVDAPRPYLRAPGVRCSSVTDPDGVLVEFVESAVAEPNTGG